LTRREREIAVLAARGQPSRQIADRLHLSVRTVDNHLQNAYAKLGVTGRDQLAEALASPSPHRPPPARPSRTASRAASATGTPAGADGR
jgi:DNA-binding CsgD family transcriptional regulator